MPHSPADKPPSIPAEVADGNLTDLAQERQQALALRWILEGTEWLAAAEVASRAAVRVATIEQWRAERKVFAINHDGCDLYPRYAFDVQMRPLALVSEVLAILVDSSAMSVAAWFESTSSFLRGKRPRELAAEAPDQVKAAAANSLELQRYPG